MTTTMALPRSKGGRPLGSKKSEEGTDIVRQVRDASGLSQEEFAGELGCSTSAVSKFEQFRRTPGTKALKQKLASLAKKYGVTAS